jgi:hypothetical protein
MSHLRGTIDQQIDSLLSQYAQIKKDKKKTREEKRDAKKAVRESMEEIGRFMTRVHYHRPKLGQVRPAR